MVREALEACPDVEVACWIMENRAASLAPDVIAAVMEQLARPN